MSGILVSTGEFHVSIVTLIVCLIISGILGNYTGYWFGCRTGKQLLNRKNSLFFKKQYIELASNFYIKHGGLAIVLGRFFPIIRTFAPIFAGIVKVDFKKVTLYNILGSVGWVNVFTLSGYFLGLPVSGAKKLFGIYNFRFDIYYKHSVSFCFILKEKW